MKIRTKLFLSFGFLFLVILLLGSVNTYFIQVLANNSGNIIKDNFRTLNYVHNMDNALYELSDLPKENEAKAIDVLKNNLDRQQKNITETGEQALTDALSRDINTLLSILNKSERDDKMELIRQIHDKLSQIYDLNQDEILRKNNMAQETSKTAFLYVWLFSFGAGLLAFFTFMGITTSMFKSP